MLEEIKGKTALITGASRGIGAATATTLARAGADRILIHYNMYREGAQAVAEAVQELGAKAELLEGDLCSQSAMDKFCAAIRREKIDILINNAGHLVERAKLLDFSSDLFDRVMNLNVKSVYFVSQAVALSMIDRHEGVIVNVSSIAARNGGGPGATIYAAAKAAVSTMTKGMARELAPLGIRVNAVSPGTIDNYFHEKYSTQEMLQNMRASTPAGRLGTNEEVADVILFLCSNASRYMHGQTVEVNGGMFMA